MAWPVTRIAETSPSPNGRAVGAPHLFKMPPDAEQTSSVASSPRRQRDPATNLCVRIVAACAALRQVEWGRRRRTFSRWSTYFRAEVWNSLTTLSSNWVLFPVRTVPWKYGHAIFLENDAKYPLLFWERKPPFSHRKCFCCGHCQP